MRKPKGQKTNRKTQITKHKKQITNGKLKTRKQITNDKKTNSKFRTENKNLKKSETFRANKALKLKIDCKFFSNIYQFIFESFLFDIFSFLQFVIWFLNFVF